jgi:hypothetical protein
MKALVELASKPIVWQKVEQQQFNKAVTTPPYPIYPFTLVGGNSIFAFSISVNRYEKASIRLTALDEESLIFEVFKDHSEKSCLELKELAESYLTYWLSVLKGKHKPLPQNWLDINQMPICSMSVLKVFQFCNAL